MKIICVGRNYAAHAAELKNPISAEPVIFMKPETAQLLPRMPFFIPDFECRSLFPTSAPTFIMKWNWW